MCRHHVIIWRRVPLVSPVLGEQTTLEGIYGVSRVPHPACLSSCGGSHFLQGPCWCIACPAPPGGRSALISLELSVSCLYVCTILRSMDMADVMNNCMVAGVCVFTVLQSIAAVIHVYCAMVCNIVGLYNVSVVLKLLVCVCLWPVSFYLSAMSLAFVSWLPGVVHNI